MLKRLINQIVDAVSESPAEAGPDNRDRARAIQRATAVLMIDVALADDSFDEPEFDRMLRLIETHLDLSPEEAAELVNACETDARELVSLHEFTQLLHDNLIEDEKSAIVGMLWQVAYADGELNKYEDALILKISDLLHVNRGRVMRLKHDAKSANHAD